MPLPEQLKLRSKLLHNSASLSQGTVLAFDYGERRLGVAVGELALRIAHPLTTIHAKSDTERLEQIGELVAQWQPVRLIVGLPSQMNDDDQPLARRCRRFADRLLRRFRIDTRLVDERLSSHAAAESLAEAGVRGIRQKAMLDQVAAQHILQTYFSMRDEPA
jgi:putative holliday junction resolvase